MAGIPRISMHYQCDFCDRRFGQPERTVPVTDIGACSPPEFVLFQEFPGLVERLSFLSFGLSDLPTMSSALVHKFLVA